ncbi:MAG: twitching motility protein PilT [Acidimicrobiales bacterium]|nr:twitching motility protein PilT [Acidimicrobiales bacterium]
MGGITYDTGALLAADRNDRHVWALHRRALERGRRPVVPAGVLGQAWRGEPQAELSRFLKGCRVEPLDDKRARAAGTACARSGTADVIDATVAIGAIARGDLVASSDSDDIRRLADALDATLEIAPV